MGWRGIYGVGGDELKMKTNKVHIVLRAKFGLPQEEKTQTLQHENYQDLVNKLNTLFRQGRELMLVINEGILFVDATTYDQINDLQELTAVFHSRLITSTVHVTGIIQDMHGHNQNQNLGELQIQHFDFGGVQFAIGNATIGGIIDHISQNIEDNEVEIEHGTYSTIRHDLPVGVYIFYPVNNPRFRLFKIRQVGSFFDTASAFQQRVLQFKAAPPSTQLKTK
jgi:hypothetical protein